MAEAVLLESLIAISFRLVSTTNPIRVTPARAFKREGESFCGPSHHPLLAPESLSIFKLIGESWDGPPARLFLASGALPGTGACLSDLSSLLFDWAGLRARPFFRMPAKGHKRTSRDLPIYVCSWG